MISSIFGKTKPINYIIVLSFLFGFYWLVQFLVLDKVFAPQQILIQTAIVGVLIFSFFLVNFIVKRNKLTGINSFAILLYVLLMVLFPDTLGDNNAVVCSFFILLAMRRLISIRSLKNIKLKVFDATLWVLLASLCYDWALLYLFLVFTAIYIYEPKNIRNWMVPFAAVFVFFMIAYCILILSGNAAFLWEHYQFSSNFEAEYFKDVVKGSKRVIYIVLIVVVSLFSFVKLGKAGLGKIVSLRLIALSFIIGLILEVLLSGSEAHPLILTFFPAVVFLTNYIESINKPNIREIALILSVLVPFLVFLTDFFIRK